MIKIEKLEDRCNACGLCAKDCVAGVWRKINDRPQMVSSQYCSLCGHCVAVCPNQAIVHSELDPLQVRRLDKTLLSPKGYREIVCTRRSVRQYRDQTVPKEIVEDILTLCDYSPTASNLQNVAFTVITDKHVLDNISAAVFGFGKKIFLNTRKGMGKLFYLLLKLLMRGDDLDRYIEPLGYYIDETKKGRDFILHGAPVLIVVHGPKKGSLHSENCNIAATNIMNYAHACGLGTCYIGFLVLMLKFAKKLRKLVQLPPDRRAYACIILGYPAYGYSFTTARKKRSVEWIEE